MRLRTAAILLLVAGALLAFSLVKQLTFAGYAEFLLITLAHLLLAVAVVGLMLSAVRPRGIALLLGLLWGVAWAGFHLHELLMLLFILPPPWTLLAAEAAIVGVGLVCGVAGLVWHRGSRAAEARVSAATVLVLAVLASTFIWLPRIVSVLPGMTIDLYYPFALIASIVSALSLIAVGVYLLSRRLPREASSDP